MAATKLCIAWTGDIGNREFIESQLLKRGITVTNDVTSKTNVLALGPNPKDGKKYKAQLAGVPVVSFDYINQLLTLKELPPVSDYLVHSSAQVDLPGQSEGGRVLRHPRVTEQVVNKSARKRSFDQITSSSSSMKPYSFTTSHKRPMLQNKSQFQQNHSQFQQRAYGTTTSSSSSSSSMRQTAMANKSQYQAHDSSGIRYASPEAPGSVVALEGLIGIGKSTLCNKLTQLYPDSVDVYREETNEKFLQLFYSDPKRYGFALQWGMLKSRIYQLRLAQHDTKHGRWPHRDLLFWDRSMIGDYTFALWNHLLGGISKQEMEAYESEFGGSVRDITKIGFIKDIQLFVLMNDEPTRCKVRVEVNRKNASEQGIPLPYYQGLDDIHFHVFMELMRHKAGKVIIQPWGEYDDAVACRELYEDVIAGRRECPSVHDVPPGLSFKTNPDDENVLVYHNAKDILEHYNLITSARDAEISELTQYSEVYIPRDVCLVDPASKEVVMENLEPYQIKFFSNEFKRIVLFHLGHFQNVHFYDSSL